MSEVKMTETLRRSLTPGRTKVSDLLLGESRVMCRWRSSLWKLLWRELLAYTVAYLTISAIYRFALTLDQQLQFERLVKWCGSQYTGLPLTFLLGFYVSLVVKRWWEQYCKLPWPDNVAMYLRALVQGEQEKVKLIRRTVFRYFVLSYLLCIRRLSVRLRRRFPTMQHVVKAGLVRQDEVVRIGEEDSSEMYGSNWQMPLKWCVDIVTQAQKDGLVPSAPGYVNLITQISVFRSALSDVSSYGHIPVPLVYTQVVTLAVYVYFIIALIGEQYIIYRNPGDSLDLWYPIFMTIKFLFYFGWLRVAETLYNPFGEDDDDFELNQLLNRHFKVGLRILEDELSPPELQKDKYWGIKDAELTEHRGLEEVLLDLNGGTETRSVPEEYKAGSSPEEAVSMMEKRDARGS